VCVCVCVCVCVIVCNLETSTVTRPPRPVLIHWATAKNWMDTGVIIRMYVVVTKTSRYWGLFASNINTCYFIQNYIKI
jgi:hypothetical protein